MTDLIAKIDLEIELLRRMRVALILAEEPVTDEVSELPEIRASHQPTSDQQPEAACQILDFSSVRLRPASDGPELRSDYLTGLPLAA